MKICVYSYYKNSDVIPMEIYPNLMFCNVVNAIRSIVLAIPANLGEGSDSFHF